MGSIVLLDPSTANMIAAGEVIARPASVVKELVENSIDAGSTRILVEITDGGKSKIKVSDNGHGINSEDMELVFERHATSKISDIEDLKKIETMGFRGEALASIAAVARLKITSKTSNSPEGCCLKMHGGITEEKLSSGCAEGTIIEVEDLFFNTPARKKFLKNSSQETYFINDIMIRYGLGFPNIAFTLKNEKRTIFKTQGDNKLINSIISIYGMEAAQNLISLEASNNTWEVRGYISKPFFNRGNRKYQHFYVNNRWVANKAVNRALDNAYYTLIPKGRYPLAVLFAESKNAEIDINVDPTKNTIRIEEEQELVDFLAKEIKNALLYDKNKSLKTITSSPVKSEEQCPENETEKENDQLIMPEMLQGIKQTPSLSYKDYSLKTEVNEKADAEYSVDNFTIFGQVNLKYIICKKDEDIYIIDQHAAHERIRYEELKEKDKQGARQLIVPKKIDLTPSQTIKLEELEDMLLDLGINFEFFGGNSIILREVPMQIKENDSEKIFTELLDKLSIDKKHENITEETVIQNLACKTSIKAGQALSKTEISKLIKDLFNTKNALTCPHGRPTIITISDSWLEKEFNRT